MKVKELLEILNNVNPQCEVKIHYDGASRGGIEVIYIDREYFGRAPGESRMPDLVLGDLCCYDGKQIKNNPKLEVLLMQPEDTLDLF